MLTELETERRNRIRLSVFAYAYEFENVSLVTDGEFDALAKRIDVFTKTGNPVLDDFFQRKFDPNTGVWIWDHPELEKVADLYERLRGLTKDMGFVVREEFADIC